MVGVFQGHDHGLSGVFPLQGRDQFQWFADMVTQGGLCQSGPPLVQTHVIALKAFAVVTFQGVGIGAIACSQPGIETGFECIEGLGRFNRGDPVDFLSTDHRGHAQNG